MLERPPVKLLAATAHRYAVLAGGTIAIDLMNIPLSAA
jgi:hypothetical protein